SPSTELYNPKAFITHAASLRQAFAHCARFPTAASRRSLDRVSVPVWLIILSDQLPVLGLVGHYPTNYRDGPQAHPLAPAFMKRPALTSIPCGTVVSCCISPPFGRLSTTWGQITYVLLTRAPIYRGFPFLARLACVKRAANVRSEPGSNSPVKSCFRWPAKDQRYSCLSRSDPKVLPRIEHDVLRSRFMRPRLEGPRHFCRH